MRRCCRPCGRVWLLLLGFALLDTNQLVHVLLAVRSAQRCDVMWHVTHMTRDVSESLTSHDMRVPVEFQVVCWHDTMTAIQQLDARHATGVAHQPVDGKAGRQRHVGLLAALPVSPMHA